MAGVIYKVKSLKDLKYKEIPQEIVDKVRSNDFKSFIDKTSDKSVN